MQISKIRGRSIFPWNVENGQLTYAYLKGLAVTFFLVLGLLSILDLAFSKVNLTNALAWTIDHDIRRYDNTLQNAIKKYQ